MTFAHSVSAHGKEHFGQTPELPVRVGGPPRCVSWQRGIESVAHWETLMTQWMRDKAYLDLVASNAKPFKPGSVHDEIWRSI